MTTKFKIHPAIGIARLGTSPDSFYLAPEAAGQLPIDCDANGVAESVNGREVVIQKFRDEAGRLRRQGARFRVYRYDDGGPGAEVALDEPITCTDPRTGHTIGGVLRDIRWTAYIANKKAVWYAFRELEGEHGYASSHPLRNADVTDTNERQRLIIDPGPQSVSLTGSPRASFARVDDPVMTQTFPPELSPHSITTLGDLLATKQPETDTQGKTKNRARLVLLGGFGHSGSSKTEAFISNFANNDGWFDDEADGYVKATLIVEVQTIDGRPPANIPVGSLSGVAVDGSAWVIVGYPRYAPQIVDIVTMDDTMYDVFVRTMAYDTNIYGVPPFDRSQKPPRTPDELALWRTNARWNPDYHPRFWRDIWPILWRPNQYGFVMDFDPFTGGNPHDTRPRGNFDPGVLSVAPHEGQDPKERAHNGQARKFLYHQLRQPGQENRYTLPGGTPGDPTYRLPAMPLLCGDNPLSNTVPSKFLRLTDTMLFLLKQWADGRFIDEKAEHLPLPSDDPTPRTGEALDRGVLANLLGGAFCPGAETTWIVRNPAIYAEPYRIRLSSELTPGYLSQGDNLGQGLEPGDLTKRNAVPWQADFNECSTQPIDITYERWNDIDPGSVGDPVTPVTQTIYWWPAHRPMTVGSGSWSGQIPNETTGDLTMVTAWKNMGFVADLTPGLKPEDPNFSPALVEGWNSVPPVPPAKDP